MWYNNSNLTCAFLQDWLATFAGRTIMTPDLYKINRKMLCFVFTDTFKNLYIRPKIKYSIWKWQ